MLNIEKINQLQAELADLLTRLEQGEFAFLEYGDPSMPCGAPMSHLRIRYMQTAGGMQFGLKTVSHHVEGSGFYAPDALTIRNIAMDAVLRYHRSSNNSWASAMRREQMTRNESSLGWFGVIHSDAELSETKGNDIVAWRDREADTRFPDATTIKLEAK